MLNIDDHSMEEDFSKYNGEGTVRRKVQLRELEILVEIDRICKKHGIKYWIDFGTLLGAVRHGGFIPWDDDLDISMYRPDYRKFQEVAPKELPDWLFLQNKKTDPTYTRELNKVRDLNSLYIERHEDFTLPYKKGIFVDIFETVDYPKWISGKFAKFLTKWGRKSTMFFMMPQYITPKTIISGIIFPIITLAIRIVWYLGFITGKSDRIGFHIEQVKSSFRKDDIFPLTTIEFEGKEFPAPKEYIKMLENYYGDYMKLPKEEDRWMHSQYVHIYK